VRVPEIYVTSPRGLRWPFSKGLVVESLVNAGIGVEAADEIAHAIEQSLREAGVTQISSEELKQRMTAEVAARLGEEAAQRVAGQTQSFEEIIVRDEYGERPFSKGLLVRSLEEAGFSLKEAHELAKRVEQELRQAGRMTISVDELEDFVSRILKETYGKDARRRYQKRLEYGGGIFVVEPGGEPRVPFSKGILAQSLMAAGISPDRAYRMAREVERELIRQRRMVIDRDELRKMVAEHLEQRIGEDVAERYLVLRAVRSLERPMHILIGGVSGVGKSTLAASLAYRLGITRMTSSDSVREILRATTTRDLVPTLHTSSFNAWKALVEVLGLEGGRRGYLARFPRSGGPGKRRHPRHSGAQCSRADLGGHRGSSRRPRILEPPLAVGSAANTHAAGRARRKNTPRPLQDSRARNQGAAFDG